MSLRRRASCVAVDHGVWGEEVAVQYLKVHGYEILGRNIRPCPSDRRLEIDIIARDRLYDTIVFVEVKQHKSHDEYDVRLRGVDRRKKELLRRACRTWLLRNRPEAGCRFDVIEVFGEPYSRRKAEIDHIINVRLFVPDGKFVDWER